jgi:hypothetical protein
MLSIKKINFSSKFLSKKIIKTQNILNLDLSILNLKYPIYVTPFFNLTTFYQYLLLQKKQHLLSLITYISLSFFKFLTDINLIFFFNPSLILLKLKHLLLPFNFFLNKYNETFKIKTNN